MVADECLGCRSDPWLCHVCRNRPHSTCQILIPDSYVDEDTAKADRLITFYDGSAQMRADSKNTYNGSAPYSGINGVGRPSIRIESVDSWTHGLFITDIKHMPTTTDSSGCSVWPAFWTLGSGTWPYSEFNPSVIVVRATCVDPKMCQTEDADSSLLVKMVKSTSSREPTIRPLT